AGEVPVLARIRRALLAVVAESDVVQERRIDAEAVARGVVRREGPVIAAVPCRAAEVTLFELGVREQQVAVRVIDARMQLDLRRIDEVNEVLEAVPLAARERLRRAPVTDRIRVA